MRLILQWIKVWFSQNRNPSFLPLNRPRFEGPVDFNLFIIDFPLIHLSDGFLSLLKERILDERVALGHPSPAIIVKM